MTRSREIRIVKHPDGIQVSLSRPVRLTATATFTEEEMAGVAMFALCVWWENWKVRQTSRAHAAKHSMQQQLSLVRAINQASLR